jgi:hypothetical protein
VSDPVWRRNLRGYVDGQEKAVSDIKCLLGLTATVSLNVYDYGQNLQSYWKPKIEVLGLWILPALYGALGSLIYYMRSILSPLLPNPSFDRVAHRVALGAFAGISVAWFWSPSGADNLNVGDLSLSVFTIAFLLGFSVDVFFTLLDRLVTLAKGGISKLEPTRSAAPSAVVVPQRPGDSG